MHRCVNLVRSVQQVVALPQHPPFWSHDDDSEDEAFRVAPAADTKSGDGPSEGTDTESGTVAGAGVRAGAGAGAGAGAPASQAGAGRFSLRRRKRSARIVSTLSGLTDPAVVPTEQGRERLATTLAVMQKTVNLKVEHAAASVAAATATDAAITADGRQCFVASAMLQQEAVDLHAEAASLRILAAAIMEEYPASTGGVRAGVLVVFRPSTAPDSGLACRNYSLQQS